MYRGWVGPRANLDECGKSFLPLEFDLRTVHTVESRYTNIRGAMQDFLEFSRNNMNTYFKS